MKLDVLVTVSDPASGTSFQRMIQVSSEALNGREASEIELAVDIYVQDWLRSELNVSWQFVDPRAFGLEHRPSEQD
jgi:hypothetical protein